MKWPMVSLGNVIDFIRGITFKPTDVVPAFTHGSIVVMRTKNVQVAGLDCADLISVSRDFMKREEQKLKYGDLLISSANSWELVGKTSFVKKLDYEATAGGFISIVRAKKSKIESKYLYYWITSPEIQHSIRHLGKQTTNISNLDVARFKELKIPLPPLEEQKRIAAILDKADAIRQKRQQAIALADDFLRSVFLDMFGDPVTNPKGWEIKNLSEIAKIQIGPFGSQLHKEDYISGGIPLINPTHICNGKVEPDDDLTIAKNMYMSLPQYHLKAGDIVMGRRGEMGRCALITTNEDGWFCGTGSLYIRPHADVLFSKYLVQLLSGDAIKEHLLAASLGATMPNLNKTIIGNIKIPIPNDLTLKKYEKFEKIHISLIKNTTNSNENELFCSLSQKAFSGQL